MDAPPPHTVPRPRLAILVVGLALAAGLGTPWFLDYDEAVYAEVARQLDRIAPISGPTRAFLCNSGTEAVEAAMKLVEHDPAVADDPRRMLGALL